MLEVIVSVGGYCRCWRLLSVLEVIVSVGGCCQ